MLSPFLAVMLIALVISLAGIVALLSEPVRHKKSRTYMFASTLGSLAIFITFLFYYSVISLQQEQRTQSVIEQTSHISSILQSDFSRDLDKHYREAPGFVSELMPLAFSERVEGQDNPLIVYMLSYKIFGIWQTTILSSEFVAIDDLAIISEALQRASSPTLRRLWGQLKVDFAYTTRCFVEKLFAKIDEGVESSPSGYEKAACELLNDPDFCSLICERSTPSILSWFSFMETKKPPPHDCS